MIFRKRILIGLPIAFVFYFFLLSLMWAGDPTKSYFEKLPEALVAWGTIMLALAALLSIQNSNEQEKRRKEDEIKKESRDRKERYLNEIIDWAMDVQKISTFEDIPGFINRKSSEYFLSLLVSIKAVNTRSKYIKVIAKALDKNLKASVINTSSKLNSSSTACLDMVKVAPAPPATATAVEKFVNLCVDSSFSANEVIKLASNIKISLLS